MRKFLIVLVAIMGIQTAQADDTKNIFQQAESVQADYLAGKLDLQTARTLCKKMFEYAEAYHMEILLYDSFIEKFLPASAGLCDSVSDLNEMMGVIIEAAAYLESLDSCEQNALITSLYNYLDNEGVIPYISNDTDIECSIDDYRCVVNAKLADGSYFVMCMLPKDTPSFVKRQLGYFGEDEECVANVNWWLRGNAHGSQKTQLHLNDFDNKCKNIGD